MCINLGNSGFACFVRLDEAHRHTDKGCLLTTDLGPLTLDVGFASLLLDPPKVTDEPTDEPTDGVGGFIGEPTDEPTDEPIDEPTGEHTDEPTDEPGQP